MTYLKRVVDKGFQQPSMTVWNPAGNKLTPCLGCGQKTACAECKFKTYNKTKITELRKATVITNSKIVQQKSFKQKQIDKEEATKSLTFKLGCLQKANIFYKLGKLVVCYFHVLSYLWLFTERYREAFDVISKAVSVVEKEMENDKVKQEKLEDKWRKNLKLDGMEITNNTILSARKQEREKEGGSLADLPRLEVFGMKTGLMGGRKANANEFLNEQIEHAFLKIERSLGRADQDVELMKKKIGELEELQELLEQRDAQYKANPALMDTQIEEIPDSFEEKAGHTMDKEERDDKLREKRLKKALSKTKTMMCPDILKYKRCSKGRRCRYAHNASELLLVKPEKLMKNLHNAIDHAETEKLAVFWNPSGNNFPPCAGCGNCNFCRNTSTNQNIIDINRYASTATNKRIRAREAFTIKVAAKREKEVVSDKKKRILMKAKILLGQGRQCGFIMTC